MEMKSKGTVAGFLTVVKHPPVSQGTEPTQTKEVPSEENQVKHEEAKGQE